MSINPGSSTFYYAHLVRLLKSRVNRNKSTSYFIEQMRQCGNMRQRLNDS